MGGNNTQNDKRNTGVIGIALFESEDGKQKTIKYVVID